MIERAALKPRLSINALLAMLVLATAGFSASVVAFVKHEAAQHAADIRWCETHECVRGYALPIRQCALNEALVWSGDRWDCALDLTDSGSFASSGSAWTLADSSFTDDSLYVNAGPATDELFRIGSPISQFDAYAWHAGNGDTYTISQVPQRATCLPFRFRDDSFSVFACSWLAFNGTELTWTGMDITNR